MVSGSKSLDRYCRQMRFGPIGEEGQRRLLASRAVVCGCGALGTVAASGLVRAGVGSVRIIDRDVVEQSNLQRQILFDESDAASGTPKAEAAARKLRAANSEVDIEFAVEDLNASNVDRLLGDVDVILDGTDNFETRLLINDFALRESKPWVFGACVGSLGQSMTILPGQTACLRCLLEDVPPPGTMPTCETGGILSPASMIVASIEVAEAMKILLGDHEQIARGLLTFDVWTGSFRRLALEGLKESSDCPACQRGDYEWLAGRRGSLATSLCGRNAVQILPDADCFPDWDNLERTARESTGAKITPLFIRFHVEGLELSVFRDGRAIVKGTDDVAFARGVYSRYLGN